MTKRERVVDIATQLAVAALRGGATLAGVDTCPRALVAQAIEIIETAERDVDEEGKPP